MGECGSKSKSEIAFLSDFSLSGVSGSFLLSAVMCNACASWHSIQFKSISLVECLTCAPDFTVRSRHEKARPLG